MKHLDEFAPVDHGIDGNCPCHCRECGATREPCEFRSDVFYACACREPRVEFERDLAAYWAGKGL